MVASDHGAIAAGHPLTTEAGQEVLRRGGTAVDACCAAAFVSWVAESTLTGPGGGGFMLVHTVRDERTRLYDSVDGTPEAQAKERSEIETIGSGRAAWSSARHSSQRPIRP